MKPLLENISSGWPPSPHDPRERRWVGLIDEWEVRTFFRHNSPCTSFTEQRFIHLQLWHPTRKISVLTPSRLTEDFFELYPFRNTKIPICCITTVNSILQQHLQIPTIDPQVLALIERYFLHHGSHSFSAEQESDKTESLLENLN